MSVFLIRLLNKIDQYINNCKNHLINHGYKKKYRGFSKLQVKSITGTIKELLHSNNSLSRFGDGELKWVLNIKHMHNFEKSSPLLRKELLSVLHSNNKNLLIGLPDGFIPGEPFVGTAEIFWKQFCVKYGSRILALLDRNKHYYNTSSTRPYIDFNNNIIAKKSFRLWKKLWNNKDVFIIEGQDTRLGVGNDLFNNVHSIKRLECPSENAFESYNVILHKSVDFLKAHPNYLTLISLGPTATILACSLCNKGYRSIDIGHIDVEYEWYLLGAKEKEDLSYKYVNEVPNGHYALPVHDSKYNNEIVSTIH